MKKNEKNHNFLTIAIPTYNRCAKLERLLCQLFKGIRKSKYNNILGVYVSDNCSSDNTKKLLKELSIKYHSQGIFFAYQSLSQNKGPGANVLEVYKNSNSKYVWWFADDDNFIDKNLDTLISELLTYEPSVCNVGFIQHPYTEDNPRYSAKDHGFYYNMEYVHEVMSTKITSIIVKKGSLGEINEKAIASTYWPQVFISLPAILKSKSYYIFSKNMAMSDKDWCNIRYPPSAFYDLIKIKEKIYADHKINQIFSTPHPRVTRFSVNLNFLKLILLGKACVSPEIKKIMRQDMLDDLFRDNGLFDIINYRSFISFALRLFIGRLFLFLHNDLKRT